MKLLLRLSPDLTIKADRTRRRFLRMLKFNLGDALRSYGFTYHIEPGWVRLVVDADGDTSDVVRRVFGVHSVSRVEERPLGSLDELVAEAGPLFEPQVRGKTFAVRARTGGTAPFRGHDIEVALGARLAPLGKVKLTSPEVTCHVEVREGRAYLFNESLPAWRGLPLGSEGRAVSLVSGGFDSAVASWMILRRGAALDYVICRLGGPTHQHGALRVLQVLGDRWSYGDRPRVWIVPFETVVDKIRANGRPALWQLVLKRLMYRTAQEVAALTGGHAIVTGESVGQVSSQTLKNLRALDGRLDLPLLRPLAGLDKEEIIARSRDIGTYDISATVKEYCDIVPDKPATGAEQKWVAHEEGRVEVDLAELVAGSKVLELRKLTPQDLSIEGLEVEEIPAGAQVLDLRGTQAFRAWHWPGAQLLELGVALQHLDRFDHGATYVVVCEIGLKSAYLAERLRSAGCNAFNFRGGMNRLLPYAAARDLVPIELLPTDTGIQL